MTGRFTTGPAVVTTILLAIMTGIVFQAELTAAELSADSNSRQITALTHPGIDTVPTSGNHTFSRSRWDYDYDNWQLGTTWWDLQHNGTNGKQVAVGDNGIIHFAWMMGYDAGAATRHVVYACWDGGTVTGPIPADNTTRSGYCSLDVLDSNHPSYANAAVVALHQGSGMGGLTSTLSNDWGPCWTSFLPMDHPAGEDTPICPLNAVDNNNKVHMLSNPMFDDAPCYDATADLDLWENPDWFQLPATSSGFSAVPVTSEFDSQVALLAHNHIPVHPNDEGLIFSQTINDVWAYISDDGDFTDWEQVTAVNVTDLLDAETTPHPLPGHVYAFCDLDGVFDSEGNLHLTYTTRPYWPDSTLLDGVLVEEDYFERWCWTGQVWHAMIDSDDQSVQFSHVAGFVGRNNEDDPDLAGYFDVYSGSWASMNDRPSLAIDPANNNLYCMWRTFISRSDTSASGYGNADLWVRSSCDQGATWGPAVNITDSQTPGCAAGDCASEAWGSLAESVHEGLLHIEFVEDLEAGGITMEDATWTENPVWYLQVPTEDVPCGDAWDAAPHATCLIDTEWNWGALEDGDYEIIDFMHLLNESSATLTLNSIEILYDEALPQVDIELLDGELGGQVPPYESLVFEYYWNATIGDDQSDAVIRFNTNGGTVDFRLSNRVPLDLENAQSYIWYDSEPVGATPRGCPDDIHLAQNYPNPFNPVTTICYELSKPVDVELSVYNIKGELVVTLADSPQTAGLHEVQFNGGELPGGIYFFKLSAGDVAKTHRMLLVK